MLESTISRSACHEENKIRDKQIDHIRNSDVGFNLLYLDCINEPRYQNLRSKHSIVAVGWWHAIGARKAAAAAGRPQMTIELKSKVWEREGTSPSYDRESSTRDLFTTRRKSPLP